MATIQSETDCYDREVLGKGTFGEVARGSLGEMVAIKILKTCLPQPDHQNELGRTAMHAGPGPPRGPHHPLPRVLPQRPQVLPGLRELLEQNLFEFQKEGNLAAPPRPPHPQSALQLLRALARAQGTSHHPR